MSIQWAIRCRYRKPGTNQYDPPFLLGRFCFSDGTAHEAFTRLYPTRFAAEHAHKNLQTSYRKCSTVVKVKVNIEIIPNAKERRGKLVVK